MRNRAPIAFLLVSLVGCAGGDDGTGSESSGKADDGTPVTFAPLPYEDSTRGRNSNAYLAATGRPADDDERREYLDAIEPLAKSAQSRFGVPACVIGGMAVVEGGYGFTRTAYFADNLFGMKYWNPADPAGSSSGVSTWQLKGQPDEAYDGSVRVTANYGSDRKVFDEAPRYDNRYRAFASRQAAIDYLAGTLLQNARYQPYLENYRRNLAMGWTVRDATRQYLFEIAAPRAPNKVYDASGRDEYYLVSYYDSSGTRHYGGGGYCHLGGTKYRDQKIGPAMDSWDLYAWADDGSGGDADTTAPSVGWSSPQDGEVVAGTVTLAVAAADSVGVARVDIYTAGGGYKLCTDTSAPYRCTWATYGNVDDGVQTLVAKAYDDAGNEGTATITVTVDNGSGPDPGADTTEPAVGFTTPANGEAVAGDVALAVDAVDDVGVAKVEIYTAGGGYRLCTDTSAPYRCTWSTEGNVDDGAQTLVAKAYDEAGNVGVTSITVLVGNDADPALAAAVDNPTLPISGTWKVDTSYYYAGYQSARSAAIGDDEASDLRFTASGTTLSFYWRVSSEADYDFLEVWVDGVAKASISGSVGWTYKSITLASGSHTVVFRYRKDGATVSGADCGWVDVIRLR